MTIDIDLRCDLCVWYNFPLELVDFLSSQLEICGMFEKSLKENEESMLCSGATKLKEYQ